MLWVGVWKEDKGSLDNQSLKHWSAIYVEEDSLLLINFDHLALFGKIFRSPRLEVAPPVQIKVSQVCCVHQTFFQDVEFDIELSSGLNVGENRS
jgi:hypothetical protein